MLRKFLLSLALFLNFGNAAAFGAAGMPQIDLNDTHRLVMNGQPWHLTGYTPGLAAHTRRCDGVSREQYYKDFHTWLQSRGMTSYRTVFSFGQAFAAGTAASPACSPGVLAFDETLPYRRTGGGTAVDGLPRFDLKDFNPDHFAFWRRVIEDARTKNIVVQINVFDSWHLNKKRHTGETVGWGRVYDVYHGLNNVNGPKNDPVVTFDINNELSWHNSNPSSAIFQAQRDLVLEVLDKLGDLPNVIWEVCNEPDSDVWVQELAKSFTGPHLLVPRDIPSHRQVLHKTQHDPKPAHDALVTRFADAKPLIAHNDCNNCLLTVSDQRKKAWGVLTAGAHTDYLFNLEKREDFNPSKPADRGARDIGYLHRFLDQLDVNLHGMEPLDDMVNTPVTDGAWTFARPGDEYVIYKRDLPGNIHLTVFGLPASFVARWFNPRSGTTVAAPAVGVAIGGGVRFTPPSPMKDDWVLHVVAQEPPVPEPEIEACVAAGGTLEFPSFPVDQLPKSLPCEICNVGTAPLVIDNPGGLVSGFGFSELVSPASPVSPGSCTDLRIRFHVNSEGIYTGAVEIQNNDPDEDPYGFSLRATALPTTVPEIRVQLNPQGTAVIDGGSFTFPNYRLSELPKSQLFDICNDGSADLVIGNPGALVSGVGFSELVSPASTVAPDNCTSVRVRIHVASEGLYTGAVEIQNNDSDEDPYNISLRATVSSSAPEIRVQLNPQGTVVTDGGSFTFPSYRLSQLPKSQLFDICNDGSADLMIDNPGTLVSGFGFSELVSPASPVAPGSCTQVRVRIHVASDGMYAGTVAIQNNDPDEDPYNFTVHAAVVPEPPEIRVELVPSGLPVADGGTFDFGTRSIPDLPKSAHFNVCNDGTGDLTIDNVGALVSGSGFSELTSPASIVTPGSCTNLRVRFHVNITGFYTGAVTIENNDANEDPYNINLRGTAVN